MIFPAASMSKKIAEEIDGLVMNVKCGMGEFVKTHADARSLAQSIIAIGTSNHVRTQAIITAINARPGDRQRPGGERGERVNDKIDSAVGAIILALRGERVKEGDGLVEVYYGNETQFPEAVVLLNRAWQIGEVKSTA